MSEGLKNDNSFTLSYVKLPLLLANPLVKLPDNNKNEKSKDVDNKKSDEKHKYIFQVESGSDKSVKKSEEVRILMLDNSGSMSINTGRKLYNGNEESVINVVKASAKKLLVKSKEQKNNMHVYTYNIKAEEVKNIDNIEADNRTFFSVALDKIGEIIRTETKSNKNKNFTVVFMTDGESTEDNNDLEKSKKNFKNLIQNNPNITCKIHCIGLGKIDAAFISELAQFGNIPGSIQYCKTSDSLDQTFSIISGLFEINEIIVQLSVIHDNNDKRSTSLINIELKNENDRILGFGLLDKEIINISDVLIQNKRLQLCEEKNQENISRMILTISRQKIIELTNKYVSTNGANSKEIDEQQKEVDSWLDLVKINKIRSIFARKELGNMFNEIKKIITDLVGSIAESKIKSLSKDKLANLASNAYRHVHEMGALKAGLKKKLDLLVSENVDEYKKDEILLEKFLKELDTTKLKQAETEINKNDYLKELECYLCLDNLKSCIEKGKCLGYVIKCDRPTVAIADPTRFKLHKVFPDIICNECFHENANNSLQVNSNASGGFRDKKDPTDNNKKEENSKESDKFVIKKTPNKMIVTTSVREEANGMLPIDFTESHKFLAQILSKPIIGFQMTLDTFGYKFSQKMAIYGFAVGFFLKKESLSELDKTQLKYILETYQKFYKNTQPLEENYKKFMNNYSGRTVDIIPNIELFLIQTKYFVLDKLSINTDDSVKPNNINDNQKNNSDDKKDLVGFVLEEEMRRFIWGKDFEKTFIEKLFTIDRKTWFDSYELESENKYTKKDSDSKMHMKDNSNEKNNKESSYENPSNYKLKIDGKLLEDLVKSFEAIYSKNLRKSVMNILKHIGKVVIGDKLFSKENSLETIEKIVTFILQTTLHSENSKRRDAAEKDEIFNVFSQKDATNYLNNVAINHITMERKNIDTKIRDKYEKINTGNAVRDFAETGSLDQAAEILSNNCYIGRNIKQYFNVLTGGGIKYRGEKLYLLVSGQHKGRFVIKDVHLYIFSSRKNGIGKGLWVPKGLSQVLSLCDQDMKDKITKRISEK